MFRCCSTARPRALRRVLGCGVLFFCASALLAPLAVVHAQRSPEDATLDDMFRWGLCTSAIEYTQRQRELVSDDPQLFARWTMRLMECYSQAALREPNLDTPLWDEATRVYQEFQSQRADNPRLPWLAWQNGRNELLHAQSCLAQFLAAPARTEARDRALEDVRRILSLMDELESDIARRQPVAAREGSRGKTQAPATALERLRVDAGLVRCEALLIRSRLYPAQSSDRITAATDVNSIATEILAITGKDWSARTPMQVAKATAMLDLGQADQAVIALATMAQRNPSDPAARRAAMTAIEHLASVGDLSRAEVLLPLLKKSGGGVEYEIAVLHIALADLRKTDRDSLRESKLEKLLEQTTQIGTQYGSYWRNRAEALLRSVDRFGAPESSGTAEPESSASLQLMVVEIRQLLAAEKVDEAIEKLLRYRDDEAAAGRSANALKLAMQAFALLQRDGRYSDAADAIEATSIQFEGESNAASAHRLAITARLQALRQDAKNPTYEKLYETSLVDQLKYWPDDPLTDEVQGWLVQLLRAKSRKSELVERLWTRATHAASPSVVRKVAIDWLVELLGLSPQQISSNLESQSKEAENQAGNNAVILRLFVLAAQMLAEWPEDADAERFAARRSRLRASVSLPEDRQLAQGLELLSLVRSQEISSARRLNSDWHPESMDDRLLRTLLASYANAIQYAQQSSPPGWCQALKIDGDLMRSLVDADSADAGEFNWRCCQLRFEHWLGELDALSRLSDLAHDNPRSQVVQLNLAQALSWESQRKEQESDLLNRSTAICKRLVASSKADTEFHLAARWQLLNNQLLRGDQAGASAAAKLFLASQPIRSQVWRRRFEAVAKP